MWNRASKKSWGIDKRPSQKKKSERMINRNTSVVLVIERPEY